MYFSKKEFSLISAAMLLGFSLQALAEGGGQVIIPDSSIHKPRDQFNARTFFKIFRPNEGHDELNVRIKATPASTGSPPASGYAFATPASLACIYGLVSTVTGCNPNSLTSTSNPTGGSKAIAIVDAYHYPYALSDLQAFSTQFGLPAPNLTVVYASGSKPATSPNSWEVEEALDLQWAHAVAPNARLYLVEAASNSVADLLAAVKVANSYVSAAGGGEVSMSWGAPEFSTESLYDTYFQASGVVYFASSGDSAGTGWPCVSPNVVCVGGTTLRRSTNGDFLQEVAWNEGGGGLSKYYGRPAYQNNITTIVGNQRGVPDVSLAADPITGAWIYYTPSNTGAHGWYIVGGTSWSSPTFAGIVNSSASFSSSSSIELTKIYNNLGNSAYFKDIVNGWCYFDYATTAVPGWDACTGVGSNWGKSGK
jgi:subtilase family serine protease